MKIKRIYHHYLKCEEYSTSMWKSSPISEREILIEQSKNLLIDIDKFNCAMMKVINEWKFSCESNFTASMNHQAWLGAAACAINHNCSEELTRLAWSLLSEQQQKLANIAADNIKSLWFDRYLNGNKMKIVKISREDSNFYSLLGCVFGSREIAKEVGINVYDDADKQFYLMIDNEILAGLISVKKRIISDCYTYQKYRKQGILDSLIKHVISDKKSYLATCTNMSKNVFYKNGFKVKTITKNFTRMELNNA